MAELFSSRKGRVEGTQRALPAALPTPKPTRITAVLLGRSETRATPMAPVVRAPVFLILFEANPLVLGPTHHVAPWGPARCLTCPTGRPVLGGSCRASSAVSIFLSGPCSPASTRGRTWERSVEQATEPHGHRTLHGCHLSFLPATPHTVPEWLHPGDHQGQPASSPGPGPDPKKSGKLAAV